MDTPAHVRELDGMTFAKMLYLTHYHHTQFVCEASRAELVGSVLKALSNHPTIDALSLPQRRDQGRPSRAVR